MRKLQVLYSIALLLISITRVVHGSSAAASGARSSSAIFSDDAVDREFATTYSGTMRGMPTQERDQLFVAAVRRTEANSYSCRAEDLEIVREYYFGVFSTFMQGLRERNTAPSTEFMNLSNRIAEEVSNARSSSTSDARWYAPLESIFIRALLLASGEGSPEAQDILSAVPGMDNFFGALAPTPPCLLKNGNDSTTPAWQHSTFACIINGGNTATRGNRVREPSLSMIPLDGSIIEAIKMEADRCGLPRSVFLPILDLGIMGITAIVEMWLEHVYPIPLTYGSYSAHGIELGAAVGAMHDKAHGTVDNRRFAVMTAIIDLLKKAGASGKDVRSVLPLATRLMVERYTQFNSVLRAYVHAKKAKFLTNNRDADAARSEYNRGITALFMALHEFYGFQANVLEQETLASAATKLCANGNSIKDHDEREFDELGTLFNPISDLSDAEIIARIGKRTLQSVNIFPTAAASVTAPVTIGDYSAKLNSWFVSRGRVYTEVRCNEIATGKEVKWQIATARYVFDSAQDHNRTLALSGLGLQKPNIDFAGLATLAPEHADRAAAREQVKRWIAGIKDRLTAMNAGFTADLLGHVPAAITAGYDDLVARQNAQWQALMA